LPQTRLAELNALITPHIDKNLGELKSELGEAAGWGELRLVLAYRKCQGGKSESV
jgi:hypothetical protein